MFVWFDIFFSKVEFFLYVMYLWLKDSLKVIFRKIKIDIKKIISGEMVVLLLFMFLL